MLTWPASEAVRNYRFHTSCAIGWASGRRLSLLGWSGLREENSIVEYLCQSGLFMRIDSGAELTFKSQES